MLTKQLCSAYHPVQVFLALLPTCWLLYTKQQASTQFWNGSTISLLSANPTRTGLNRILWTWQLCLVFHGVQRKWDLLPLLNVTLALTGIWICIQWPYHPKSLQRSYSYVLDYWLQLDQSVSAKEAASLHGKLVHISCIFPLIQPFLHGVAQFPLSFWSPQGKLQAPPPFHADLSWVCFVIQSLPNKVPLAPAEPIYSQWWGDTSTSFRIGLVLGSHWAIWKWSPDFKVGIGIHNGRRQRSLRLSLHSCNTYVVLYYYWITGPCLGCQSQQ